MLLLPALAASLALFTFWLHTFVGHRVVLLPIRNTAKPGFARATIEVCWHFTSHVLALQSLALAWAAIPGAHTTPILIVVGGTAFPFALLFIATSMSYAQKPFTLPQSTLLAPIGLLALFSLYQPVNLPVAFGLALIISLIFVILAALHVAWGIGSPWPAKSHADLVELVVGLPRDKPFPGFIACQAVAVCFLAAGVMVILAATNQPSIWSRIAIYGLASLFTLRTIAGYAEPYLRPWTTKLPYHHWNRVLYSPLCLLLAILLGMLGQEIT